MTLPKYCIKHTYIGYLLFKNREFCEPLSSFREGYLASESGQHAPKEKTNLQSHFPPDSALLSN
jgi:hypothetical protein